MDEIIDYRAECKKKIDEITDEWILKQIYRFVQNMAKEN